MTKICSTCKEKKEITLFCKAPRNLDGYSILCKACKRQYDRTYRAKPKSPEKLAAKKAYLLKYLKENRDIILVKKKEKYYANLLEERAKRLAYMKARVKRDPILRLRQNLNRRIRCALTRQKSYKNNKTLELLGCTLQEFKTYLESLFQEGMSWGNYNKWHVDHKIPCASFNLLDLEDRKKCFHYSNLQPLWAIDNLKKGKKII